MKKVLIPAIAAAGFLVLPAAYAPAFAADAPATTPHYTTAATPLGNLLDDPAAKAILVKYIPEVISNEQIDMARGMTLKQLQAYAGDAITDQKLADIDADLAKLASK